MRKVVFVVALALLWSTSSIRAAPTPPPQAKGVLRTADGAEIGNVLFTQLLDGSVYAAAAVKNLPAGEHGFTIRERGACTPNFDAAGGARTTDLPRLTVMPSGMGTLGAKTTTVSISTGANALLDADGTAVIITAQGDENTTVACAVLEAVAVPGPLPAAAQATGASAEFKTSTGETVGSATMTQNADGSVRVQVQVRGLPAGVHAMHIHQFGMCAPTFGAAGEHHNPRNTHHGAQGEDPKPHAGDLPSLTVNAEGTASIDTTTTLFTLSPGDLTALDTDGSALIIHAQPDDERTDPTGNAGGRIACAVVQPVLAAAPAATPAPTTPPAPTVAPPAPTVAPPAPTVAPAPTTPPAGGGPVALPDTGGGEQSWLLLSLFALAALVGGFLTLRTRRS